MGKLVPQVEKVAIHTDLKKSSSKSHKKPTVLKNIKKIQKIKKALKHKLKKPIEISSKVWIFIILVNIIHPNFIEPRNTSLSRIIWCKISFYILNLFCFLQYFNDLWVFQKFFCKIKGRNDHIVRKFILFLSSFFLNFSKAIFSMFFSFNDFFYQNRMKTPNRLKLKMTLSKRKRRTKIKQTP